MKIWFLMNGEEREAERQRAIRDLDRLQNKYTGFYEEDILDAKKKIKEGAKPSRILYNVRDLIARTRPTPEEIEEGRKRVIRKSREGKADGLYKTWEVGAKSKIVSSIISNPKILDNLSYSTEKKHYHTGGSFWDYPSEEHIVTKKGDKYTIETYDGSKQDSPNTRKVSREYDLEEVAGQVANGFLEGGRQNRKQNIRIAKWRGINLRERGNLEKYLGLFAIIGLIGAGIFFSFNFTGNVIGLNQSTGNILGAVLLVVGLVGSFFWFRSRKR